MPSVKQEPELTGKQKTRLKLMLGTNDLDAITKGDYQKLAVRQLNTINGLMVELFHYAPRARAFSGMSTEMLDELKTVGDNLFKNKDSLLKKVKRFLKF